MNINKKIVVFISTLLLIMPITVLADNNNINLKESNNYFLTEDDYLEEEIIEKTDLTKATVLGIKTKTYTGKAQRQNIKVILDDNVLTKDNDYKITYKNNYSTGKATMKITGIGNYTGVIVKTFKIIPSKPTVFVKYKTKSSITFNWKKISTSTGYQIAFRQMGPNKYKYYIVKNTSKTFTNLKSQRYHQMKVRAYKTIDGKKYYGSWSYVKKVRTY